MTTPKTSESAPVRRRRPWTAAQKAAMLRAFAASGLSATAFCRAHDVPRATLTLWRRTTETGAAPRRPTASPPAFARVDLIPAPEARRDAPGAAVRAASAPDAAVEGPPVVPPPVVPPPVVPPPVVPPPASLTLALRAPDGLEAALSGLDVPAAVVVLRGVFAPASRARACSASGAGGRSSWRPA